MRLVESNRVDNNIISNLIESEKKVIKEANEYTFTYGNDENIVKGSDNPAFKDKYKVIINGKEIKPGDKIKDFRGEEHIFKGVTNPGTTFGGMNGKIVVTHGDGEMEYYPSVFDAKLEKINEEAEPKKEEEEVSFDEIEHMMSVATTYEELYNAVELIKDPKIRENAEDMLNICKRDGDDVETAYSVTTTEYIDPYRNDKNIYINESVNNKSYNKTFNESCKVLKKKNLKEASDHKMNSIKYKADGYTNTGSEDYMMMYKGKPLVDYKEKDFKKGTTVLTPFICDECGNEFYVKSDIHDFFKQGDFDDPYESPSEAIICPKCKNSVWTYNGAILIKEPGENINKNENNNDRTLEYRRSEFSKIPLKDGSYKIKILSATSETKYLDITEKEFASIERLLTTKE